jgi:hypothetical protein
VTAIVVDGRDFLYNFAFQEVGNSAKVRLLREVFGKAIERYLVQAWASDDMDYRIAMCDLAIQDNDVIEAHAKNTCVIGGRHNTVFCSAFIVKLPVNSRDILGFPSPVSVPAPQLSIDQFRAL